MRTLIFDTETTGKADHKSKQWEHQPHPVSLACELFHEGESKGLISVMINAGVEIPTEASNIHKITNEHIQRYGVSMRYAIGGFVSMLMQADRIVAHNIDFDIIVMEAAIYRTLQGEKQQELLSLFRALPRICTMRSSTDILKLPGKYGYKWPTLEEAYKALVNEHGFEEAHTALGDIRACKAVLDSLELQGAKLVGGLR